MEEGRRRVEQRRNVLAARVRASAFESPCPRRSCIILQRAVSRAYTAADASGDTFSNANGENAQRHGQSDTQGPEGGGCSFAAIK